MSLLVNDIVTVLKDGIKIKLTKGLFGPYKQLVFGGYVNYNGKFISKNWKTKFWGPK